MTPLMVAAAYGSVACIDVLLSPLHLVDPNRASPSSLSTALHLAAAAGASAAPAAVSRLLAALASFFFSFCCHFQSRQAGGSFTCVLAAYVPSPAVLPCLFLSLEMKSPLFRLFSVTFSFLVADIDAESEHTL
jgi:hypothetical protein